MRFRIFRFSILIIIISTLIYFNGGLNFLTKGATAFAVGDLTVDWGVAPGSPIFSVSNFAPGQTQSRIVHVTNNSATPQPIGVRGKLVSQTNNLSNVLNLVITDENGDIYGGTSGTGVKTLAQFFSESATISGVPLSTIKTGASKNYTFTVTFQTGAGNQYQNSQLTFDISMGIFFQLPVACQGIVFSGNPLFGTEGNDHLQGTSKNDLIISFDGQDVVDGGSGDDCIISGNGNNAVVGGAGNDVIIAGNGNNNVSGGSGDDKIFLGNGINNVDGGSGNDQITTGDGLNRIAGGSGDDAIISSLTRSLIDGGSGKDKCVGKIKVNCEM